jgi:hypothetical protein
MQSLASEVRFKFKCIRLVQDKKNTADTHQKRLTKTPCPVNSHKRCVLELGILIAFNIFDE